MYGNRGYGGGHREGGGGGYGGSGGGYGSRPMQQTTAPVKVGEEMEVTIEAVGEKGDGLAKKNGFVLFVPGVKEGQKVRIRVTKVLRKVGFAEVVGSAGSAPAEGSEEAPAEGSSEEAPAEGSSEEAPAEESQGDSEDFGEDNQQ